MLVILSMSMSYVSPKDICMKVTNRTCTFTFKIILRHHFNFPSFSGQIPVVQLNYSALSFESPFDRDTVETCVREVVNAVSRSVAAKRNVEFIFSGIGRLQIRDSKVKMRFYKSFLNSMDGSGRLIDMLRDVSVGRLNKFCTYSKVIYLV